MWTVFANTNLLKKTHKYKYMQKYTANVFSAKHGAENSVKRRKGGKSVDSFLQIQICEKYTYKHKYKYKKYIYMCITPERMVP